MTLLNILWNPKANSTTPELISPGIPQLMKSGTVIMGYPVGSPNFSIAKIEDQIHAIRNIIGILPNFKDPDSEFVLLQSSFYLPKVMHLT